MRGNAKSVLARVGEKPRTRKSKETTAGVPVHALTSDPCRAPSRSVAPSESRPSPTPVGIAKPSRACRRPPLRYVQQLELEPLETPWPWPTCTLGLVLLVAVVPMRSLIWRAMVRKACSTLLALLADVSRKGMPRLSANSCCAWSAACVQGEGKWQPGGRARRGDATRHLRPYLRHGVFDHLLVRHIALVAYEELVDAFGGVPVNLLQPLLDVVERVHVRNIVDDADAVGPPVVRRRDGPEPFLAGRIPLFPSVSGPRGAGSGRGGLRSGA